MALPVSRGSAIPTGERRSLAGPVQRTTLLRAVLGLSLLVVFAAALAEARGADERVPPLLPEGDGAMVALDLSGSISDFERIAETIRRLARDEARAGLVAFSGGAYELLPPRSPARELESYVRFFAPAGPSGNAYRVNPWDAAGFRGGTSIAAGLEAAHYALQRDGVRRGSIVLMSDLQSVSDNDQQLRDVVVAVRRSGYDIRVVPVGARPENRAFLERILGRAAFLAETDPEAPVATPAERRWGGTLPWSFLALAVLMGVLLALNERFLSRLDVRA